MDNNEEIIIIEDEDLDIDISEDIELDQPELVLKKSKKQFKDKYSLVVSGIILLLIITSVGLIASPDIRRKVIDFVKRNPITNDGGQQPIDRLDTPGVKVEPVSITDEEQAELDAIAERSSVEIIISSSPFFADATSEGSFFISNPSYSNYDLQVVITTEDGREVYVSPLLKAGQGVDYDVLTDQTLEAGSHDARAVFNYYMDVNGEPAHYASMVAEITIVIEK